MDWTVKAEIHRIVADSLKEAVSQCVEAILAALQQSLAVQLKAVTRGLREQLEQQLALKLATHEAKLEPAVSHLSKEIKDIRQQLAKLASRSPAPAKEKGQLEPKRREVDEGTGTGNLGQTVLSRVIDDSEEVVPKARKRPRNRLFRQ